MLKIFEVKVFGILVIDVFMYQMGVEFELDSKI